MYYCNSVLQQEDQELKSSYCKSRFCLVCNSIKTANLINGYVPELEKMKEPQFLTLTIKAVGDRQLRMSINKMLKDFRTINQTLTKLHKIKLSAIRKLECNHNDKYNTYNPHFHLIIDGLGHAQLVQNMWLKLNPRSKEVAQNIRPADLNSMKELFKYATKIISKGSINAFALDVIYTALKNKRVIQPIGIKKFVDEDEREKVVYEKLTSDSAVWAWNDKHFDWFNLETGECLTYFKPDKEIKTLYERSEIKKQDNTELRE